jgi:hypothetical protein
MNNVLYIWIEGDDDERFFKSILVPLFKTTYHVVIVQQYAIKTKEWINNFIKSINSMNAHYIFVADFDHNKNTCVTQKKSGILSLIQNLEENKIIIVKEEIESWYLAGLTDIEARHLKMNRLYYNTDKLTKEEFDQSIPRKFTSRIDFMIEVIKRFSIDTAKKQNNSFKYFMTKYNL